MVVCSILSCGLRKGKNNPDLTLHRLPRKNLARKKWLDILGSENLNLDSKCIHICSMHFEQSCFNRTLDVVRLHDDSVPSLNIVERTCAQPEKKTSTLTTEELYNQSMTQSGLAYLQSEKIQKLMKRCSDQRRKITRIAETIRRREKKISELHETRRDLINEIKKRKLIINEKSLLLDESVSSNDRQKNSAKRFYHIKTLKNH